MMADEGVVAFGAVLAAPGLVAILAVAATVITLAAAGRSPEPPIRLQPVATHHGWTVYRTTYQGRTVFIVVPGRSLTL